MTKGGIIKDSLTTRPKPGNRGEAVTNETASRSAFARIHYITCA